MGKLIIIIGAYGSGKSEYSANLAKNMGKATIIDMDIMNPYFRTRELQGEFASLGIEIIAPPGAFKNTEIPMLSPRIRGSLMDPKKDIILDVGGNPQGMKVLGRYKQIIKKRGYDLRLVLNTRRPSSSDIRGIRNMFDEFEKISGLKITSVISNTHLMEHTNQSIIKEGIAIIDTAMKGKNIKFENFLVLEKYQKNVDEKILGKKKIVMNYYLSKPWE